jgi:GR25 family glycosyltransferase involved in LPS biosynthesis
MEQLLVNNKDNNFRIQAIDYKNNFHPYTVIQHPKLNGGEHGCSISHLKALSCFLESTEDPYCFIAEDDLSNEYSNYWKEKHHEYLKNDDYEILQLQTTGDSYKNSLSTMTPERLFDAGTTIYKISRKIASKIVEKHFNVELLTINLSNHNNPVADVLIWNYGETHLLPMFSYLDVHDSDTNRESNNKMNDYWKRFFSDVKTKHLLFWKESTQIT